MHLTRIFVPTLSKLAIVVVIVLIAFLAYTSQYLFLQIEPGILTQSEAFWFNLFVFFIWWCYCNACVVDAAPKGWVREFFPNTSSDGDEVVQGKTARWCKKCQAIKPPRAHHCKICATCVPKMDHHCPWTSNCVSYLNFPHFIRFVFYCVVSMSILAYHLNVRLYMLWQSRHAPAYLGPSPWALLHLFALLFLNSMILFALCILLCRLIYGLVTNKTMIESWEIERHEALVHRCRKAGGFVYAAGGQRIYIEHQEYPYDVGMWKNLYQAMGTKNVFMWFMPFGGAPTIESAGDWEINGFEDEDKLWPPPDPDKFQQHSWCREDVGFFKEINRYNDSVSACKTHQNNLRRRDHQRDIHESFYDSRWSPQKCSYEGEIGIDGEEGWTISDGDRLRDYSFDGE